MRKLSFIIMVVVLFLSCELFELFADGVSVVGVHFHLQIKIKIRIRISRLDLTRSEPAFTETNYLSQHDKWHVYLMIMHAD